MYWLIRQVLDLSNPATFRDLTKPMGAQSEGRLSSFLERYQHLEDPGPTGKTHLSLPVASFFFNKKKFVVAISIINAHGDILSKSTECHVFTYR